MSKQKQGTFKQASFIPDANLGVTDPRPKVNCDREAWVKARINTAIRMASAVSRMSNCGADETIRDSAVEGIVNGAAVEIIHMLGMEPEYRNLRRVTK